VLVEDASDGAELDGRETEGRNDDVGMALVTVMTTDLITSRVLTGPGMNVTANVVMASSQRSTVATDEMDELNWRDVVDPEADSVRLAVAFEEEDMTRYAAEARKLTNIWGIILSV
jgi:hypothetical protein